MNQPAAASAPPTVAAASAVSRLLASSSPRPSAISYNATGSAWESAALVAALLAIDSAALGGCSLRAAAGPVRDFWLAMLAAWLPAGAMRRLPLHAGEARLLGGLDLTATLRAGRPIAERGLLAQANGGLVLVAMAERIAPATAAHLGHALDTGEVAMARDGFVSREAARFGVLALDEGVEPEEQPPAALLDRLAFLLDLTTVGVREVDDPAYGAAQIEAARARLPQVRIGDDLVEALCGTAQALGVTGLRASLLAVQAARAVAALAGRELVTREDAAVAGRLVLAPRATQLPASEPPEQATDQAPPGGEARHSGEQSAAPAEAPDGDAPPRPPEQVPGAESEQGGAASPSDVVLAATQAAIPAGLLAQLRLMGGLRSRPRFAGSSGHWQHTGRRGRPAGVRRGEPRAGGRLNLIETLRAAAPWQKLRHAEAGRGARGGPARVELRATDMRVTWYRQRTQSATLFVVDASGSAALQRLAEAKGAVEMLLADCYVRRDQVALIAFRGRGASLLLPPTRSLVRAKRCLNALPGGGGTPLAAGIDAAAQLADALQRRGQTPIIVLLTDGRANVARDGTGGRTQAEGEALAAARGLRAAGFSSLLIDTALRAQPAAQRLAQAMGARYLPLPAADAVTLSRVVQAASAAA